MLTSAELVTVTVPPQHQAEGCCHCLCPQHAQHLGDADVHVAWCARLRQVVSLQSSRTSSEQMTVSTECRAECCFVIIKKHSHFIHVPHCTHPKFFSQHRAATELGRQQHQAQHHADGLHARGSADALQSCDGLLAVCLLQEKQTVIKCVHRQTCVFNVQAGPPVHARNDK